MRRGSTVADVEAVCAATGYSRFPVVGDDGELVGYLHIKDVLETDAGAGDACRRRQVDPAVRAGRAPTTPLHDALETLQRRGAHMARVVDDDRHRRSAWPPSRT